MSLQKKLTFWFMALGLLLFSLWYLQDILLPFIAGFVLAYFLDPLADRLEELGLPRSAAAAAIILVALLILFIMVLTIVPVLADQAVKLAGNLPSLVKSLVQRLNEIAPPAFKEILARASANIESSLGDIAGRMTSWIAALVASLWSGSMSVINILSLAVVTPFVAFYLLADWDRIVAKVDSWVPRDSLHDVRSIATNINLAMAGFIRGQGTVCLLLGIFYAIALAMTGLNFGLAIGFGAGFLTFIPYLGATIGGVLAIGVALVQFWPDWTSILAVVGIFVAGQFIEGNFLSPKLVGSSIGLHPVWLMFALFAFSYVFGFAGLLLAVPLAAAAGVISRHFLERYLQSRLYTGTHPEIAIAGDTLPIPRLKGRTKVRS